MQPSPFARANSPQSIRGTATTERGRGRARGRGRGRGSAQGTTSDDASTPFQSNRGSTQRADLSGALRGTRSRGTRGTGRGGNLTRSFNNPTPASSQSLHSGAPTPLINPRPEDIKETNHEVVAARRTKLHGQYEQYQKRAIQQKLMSDPDKREKLENAIFTKGTCTHMCDEKERVDRIFELQLDRAEMLPHPETGQLVPIEGRMVKRFRRSAAGVGKQIPEELRTPETLQRTMDYLFDNIIGPNPRLAQHHKFVWDRTRAIRNDCSIQSFTQPEDVKREVDCYERIARFHILSSHILSKPGALQGGEDFVHKQEIEQLTKTFQTLMDKYDGYSSTLDFPHEAEFRAYFILFAPMTTIADLDDQVQRWPRHVLEDGRVQTALKLRVAGESTDQPVGSRRFEPVPCFIAQKNAGLYWELLRSQRVGYLMACVAEMSFRNIRFAALDSLWRTGKNAPEKGQATMRTWTKAAIRDYLGLDDDDQAEEFCSKFGLNFVRNASSDHEYLDFKSHSAPNLDYSSLGQEQVFSETLVESKRHGRNLVAILNGMSIAAAAKEGMLEQNSTAMFIKGVSNKSNMFLSQNAEDDEADEAENGPEESTSVQTTTSLNPMANAFKPSPFKQQEDSAKQPSWMTGFGQTRLDANVSPFSAARKNSVDQQGGEPVNAGTPAQSPFKGLGAFQQPSSQTPSSFKADVAPSLQKVDVSSFKPAAQSSFVNHNPFATLPPSGASHILQPTQQAEVGSPAAAQEIPAAQSLKTSNAFSWPPAPVRENSSSPQPFHTNFNDQEVGPKPIEQQSTKLQPSLLSQPAQPVSVKPFFNLPRPSSQLQPIDNRSTDPSSSKAAQTDGPLQSSLPIEPAQSIHADANQTHSAVPALQTNSDKPSFTAFKPLPAAGLATASTTPAGSPARPLNPFNAGVKAPLPAIDLNEVVSTSSPAANRESVRPEPPRRKPIDKDQLIGHLCRIGLVQKDGILDMFVAAKVNSLCNDVFQAFQTSRLNRRISKLKKLYLSRKFFALWRSRVHLKRLQKRAEKRKRMFAASLQAENEEERRRREEVAFLAEIVKSERNKRKIQEEQARRNEEKARRQNVELQRLQAQNTNETAAAQIPQSVTNSTQTAGQKRKMLTNKSSRNDLHDIAMSPMHKRSRTLGTSSDKAGGFETKTNNVSTSKMPSSSNLRRSLSHRSLRQSITQHGVDQTESDYFRLKALGIDPNTPLLPDTAATLAAKQKRAAEHRESVLSKVKNRPRSIIVKSPSGFVPPSIAIPKSSSTPQVTSATQNLTRPSPSVVDESEDTFLRELREARQAMTADAEWLKSEAVKLEKEIEQEEELRRSIGSNRSTEEFNTHSVDGFARSVSGHAYVPPVLKPGQTLSRTEQRIRATGARGLANLPIGGSPHSISQYMPVAMSRRSASQLQRSSLSRDQVASPSSRSKRSIDDVDIEVRNGLVNSDFEHSTGQPSQSVSKKVRHVGADATTTMSIQALQAVQSSRENGYDSDGPDDETGDELEYVTPTHNGDSIYDSDEEGREDEEQYSGDPEDNEDDDDDEDAETDEHSDEQEQPVKPPRLHPQYGSPGAHGEAYDEDDEEEIGEEDDEDDLQHRHAQFLSLVPGSGHGSRAVSAGVATPDTGLGSTLDDAIELSD